jgi:hypothetical protein
MIASRNIKNREYFCRGNKVFHKKHGIGIVRCSQFSYLYFVDWDNGGNSKNTAQTLKLISASSDSHWYIDVVNNMRTDLKTYIDNSFFKTDKDAFDYVFKFYDPDKNHKDRSFGWFEEWIAIGLVGIERDLISNKALGRLSAVIYNNSIYNYEDEYEKEEFEIVLKDYELIKSKINNEKCDTYRT